MARNITVSGKIPGESPVSFDVDLPGTAVDVAGYTINALNAYARLPALMEFVKTNLDDADPDTVAMFNELSKLVNSGKPWTANLEAAPEMNAAPRNTI